MIIENWVIKMSPARVHNNRIMKQFEFVNDLKLSWTHSNSQSTIRVIIMKSGWQARIKA
jgi:hypothetical protein